MHQLTQRIQPDALVGLPYLRYVPMNDEGLVALV